MTADEIEADRLACWQRFQAAVAAYRRGARQACRDYRNHVQRRHDVETANRVEDEVIRFANYVPKEKKR